MPTQYTIALPPKVKLAIDWENGIDDSIDGALGSWNRLENHFMVGLFSQQPCEQLAALVEEWKLGKSMARFQNVYAKIHPLLQYRMKEDL